MKKFLAIPILAVLSGIAAFVLCLLQNQTGFEAGTGLPVPGSPMGLALIGLLAGTTLIFALLTMLLPKEIDSPDFLSAFSTTSPALLMLPVAGILLMGLSGALDIASGLGLFEQFATVITADGTFLSTIVVASESFSPTIHLFLGILSLLSAGSLFPVIAACRYKETEAFELNSTLLLIPPAVLVVRLVLTYRIYSVNPVLMAYYVELLALVFLTLGFYRLASFAFQSGRTKRFSLYAATSLPFCMAALANNSHPAASLLYLGGGVTLLGFLLLHSMQANPNK